MVQVTNADSCQTDHERKHVVDNTTREETPAAIGDSHCSLTTSLELINNTED
jgi:hypothetical protein